MNCEQLTACNINTVLYWLNLSFEGKLGDNCLLTFPFLFKHFDLLRVQVFICLNEDSGKINYGLDWQIQSHSVQVCFFMPRKKGRKLIRAPDFAKLTWKGKILSVKEEWISFRFDNYFLLFTGKLRCQQQEF